MSGAVNFLVWFGIVWMCIGSAVVFVALVLIIKSYVGAKREITKNDN